MKIDFSKTNFVTSSIGDKPRGLSPFKEVLFVGRSNVGKSSLINALTNRKNLARVSSKPGHTKLLNYFDVDHTFYLVDAPGYGYAKSGRKDIASFGAMMEKYFHGNSNLSLIVFLVDARRELNDDDKMLLDLIEELNINFIIVLTKSDKLNQSLRYRTKMYYQNNYKHASVIFYSAISKEGLPTLQEMIVKTLLLSQ